MKIVPKEDVAKDSGKYGRYTRYKRCHKCGTININLELTEVVRMTTKYEKRYMCDNCDKIKG